MNACIQPIPSATGTCRRQSACAGTRATLTAVLLLGLAMAGPAAAGRSDNDPQEYATFETDDEAFVSDEDDLSGDDFSGEDDFSGDNEFMDMAEAEASSDAAASEEQSEGKRLKKGLKRILVDSLLTAAKRKTHDTLGISEGAGAGQEHDPEP